jgi:hypothetical protein
MRKYKAYVHICETGINLEDSHVVLMESVIEYWDAQETEVI